MEQFLNALEILDFIPTPAFCVKDGVVIKVNSGAMSHMIEVGTPVEDLLKTGREEYADFKSGCLYLNINVCSRTMGMSVRKVQDMDVFSLEQVGDQEGLNAMALAARELREPMAGLMITGEHLLPELQKLGNADIDAQVARMNRCFYQILRMLGNMSDAPHYAAGSGKNQEMVELGSVISEVFDKAQTLVEQAGLHLTFEGVSDPVYTLADSEKLERAIYNIISNAMKFTPQGGLIQGKLVCKGKKVYLSIRDNGSGIAKELRGSIYSRYIREPGLEDGRFGIGLGLVLVRSVASVHGGTVLVDHPDGVGTRITMSLSIRQDKTATVRSPRFRVDYAGERDHGLLELAECLPTEAYQTDKIR